MSKQIGLLNVNNTCYVNSVLQSLLSMDKFTQFVKCLNTDSPLIDNFINIINYVDEKSKNNKDKFNIVKPASFLESLYKESYFTKGTQEDAHELLLFLLDYIHEKSKTRRGDSIVKSLFHGTVNSRMLCECGKVTNNNDDFVYISISSDSKTIDKGVTKYINNMEKIKSSCAKCELMTEKVRTQQFKTIPEYLIIQVMRFNNDLTKKEDSIDVDTTIMNDEYTLSGIIFHSGTLSRGHYYYGKPHDNTFIIIDDNIMMNVPTLNGENVYLAIYKKNLH